MRESIYVHAESSNPAKTMLTTNTQGNGCQRQFWKIHGLTTTSNTAAIYTVLLPSHCKCIAPLLTLAPPGAVYVAENCSSLALKNTASVCRMRCLQIISSRQKKIKVIWRSTNELRTPSTSISISPSLSKTNSWYYL